MKITQLGKALDKEKYVIDEKSKSFSTTEDNLVLDFSDEYGWVFKTGSDCTFDTGYGCTFNTGSNCVAVRRDIYEVIEIPEGKKIKINEYGTKGWKEAEK